MQTLNETTPPLGSFAPAPTNAVAALVKDGWLFITVAHLSLVAGIMAWVVSSNGILYEKDPGSVGLVVSCTVWMVLCSLGLFKLRQARRAGELSWKIRAVLLVAWVGAGVLGHAIVDIVRAGPYEPICYALVFAALMAVGIRAAYRQPECQARVEQRGLMLVLLGTVLVAYGVAFYLAHYPNLYEPDNQDFFNSTFPAIFSYTCGALWIVLCLAGARPLAVARRAGVVNGWTRWGTRLLLLHAVVFADLVLLHARIHNSYQWLLVTAVTLGVPSLMLGFWFASIRRKAVSRRRLALFCAPLLFFSIGVVAPAVGIITDCAPGLQNLNDSRTAPLYSSKWAWPLTEIFVLPIAREFAERYPAHQDIYHFGFIPLAVLKDNATGMTALPPAKINLRVASFYGWARRDREGATAYALSLGQASQPKVPLDVLYQAGEIIAHNGTHEQVIERLTGNYDVALKIGVLQCVMNERRTQEYLEQIVGLTNQVPYAWYALQTHPNELTTLWRAFVRRPTNTQAMILGAVCSNSYLWSRIDVEAIKEGLHSENGAVRKLALSHHEKMPTLNKDDWQRVLASTRGETPACDATEQRRANVFLKMLMQPAQSWRLTFPNPAAPGTPLTPAELSDIITTCTKAEEALSKK